MLLDGFNHVATLTNDSERLHAFYVEVFEAEIVTDIPGPPDGSGVRLTIIEIGPHSELNVFQVDGSTEADHLAVQAASLEAFDTIRQRLMARGAADDFVTDFGPMLSVFFRDPDGLECEVCVTNPDHQPGVFHPPGTRAARYPAA